jgi:hypothetical protein
LDRRGFTGLKLSPPRPRPPERAQDVGGLNTSLKMGIDVGRQNFWPTVLPLEGNGNEDLYGIVFLCSSGGLLRLGGGQIAHKTSNAVMTHIHGDPGRANSHRNSRKQGD